MARPADFTGYADPHRHAAGLYIGGNWSAGDGIAVIDPSTGNRLVEVADAGVDDVLTSCFRPNWHPACRCTCS